MNSTENTVRLGSRRDGYWTLLQAILWIVTRYVAAVQPLSRSTNIGATMLAIGSRYDSIGYRISACTVSGETIYGC